MGTKRPKKDLRRRHCKGIFFKMLKNVVGLVTGGSSGLGRATVDRFVREGAKVTLLDLPSSKGADVAKELGEDNCIFIPGDVTKEDSVKTALEEGKAKWGKINAAVNCAGIGVLTRPTTSTRIELIPWR